MLSINDLRKDDPLHVLARVRTKLHTQRIRLTYGFARFGHGNSIHYRADVRRSSAHRVIVEDDVYLGPEVWLNVVSVENSIKDPAIILRSRCAIGRRTIIAAKNCIELEEDVLTAPSVYITDHPHEYSNVDLPIWAQGISEGGTVRIEKGCWLGVGSVIYCGRGELVLGRNCVVGANAVVNRSFPPYSVVAGNPARMVKRYDPEEREWKKIQQIDV